MKTYNILNLGAGVQSTALYLLAMEGKITRSGGIPVIFDYAVFADTQEEPEDPGESVYKHLEWLKGLGGPPIIIGTAGKLGEHLFRGTRSTGQGTRGDRFASIPCFTIGADGKKGKMKRQCTKEYKIEVIERAIRRQVIGLQPRQRIPLGVIVNQYIGISADEAGRMLRAQKRQDEKPIKWVVFHYPLIQSLNWTREDCRTYLAGKVPHRVPRSACTFCPFHSNEEWQRIKVRAGKDWERVIEIDRALRLPGMVVNRDMNAKLFLHRSCKPIDEIDFVGDRNGDREMAGECEGMCGN